MEKQGRKLEQNADGTLKLSLEGIPLKGIKSIQGAPITTLNLQNTGISDIGPLTGMPLKGLYLWNSKVKDLTPPRPFRSMSPLPVGPFCVIFLSIKENQP